MRSASIVTGLFLAALRGASSAAAEDGVAVTGEAALRALFADQTFHGHTREGAAWTEYYWPDGRSSYEQDACVTAGEWRVSENGACFAYPTFENGEVACYLLFRNDGQIDFVPDEGGDPDAEFIAESIKPGNAERLPPTPAGNCGG
jgi:hypothetical protein